MFVDEQELKNITEISYKISVDSIGIVTVSFHVNAFLFDSQNVKIEEKP